MWVEIRAGSWRHGSDVPKDRENIVPPQIFAVNFNLATTLPSISTPSSTTMLAFIIRSADNDVPSDQNNDNHKAAGRDQRHKPPMARGSIWYHVASSQLVVFIATGSLVAGVILIVGEGVGNEGSAVARLKLMAKI
ncbi:hypothetical protein NM208_g12766 [Fusarium decemcellulare]|uniref:Uncharacterized protein n=1 Tax=Fusarium decemcellulare TaxID=57161 RepID=A0ACC1RN01_9HYPO|nr:hypothetical protein NM208_g12766 [Fusarium decemcellulare]